MTPVLLALLDEEQIPLAVGRSSSVLVLPVACSFGGYQLDESLHDRELEGLRSLGRGRHAEDGEDAIDVAFSEPRGVDQVAEDTTIVGVRQPGRAPD